MTEWADNIANAMQIFAERVAHKARGHLLDQLEDWRVEEAKRGNCGTNCLNALGHWIKEQRRAI